MLLLELLLPMDLKSEALVVLPEDLLVLLAGAPLLRSLRAAQARPRGWRVVWA